MNSSSSRKELHSSPSEGTLNLTKLGGDDWINLSRFNAIGNPVKPAVAQHKIFEKQASAINHSDAIEQMLQTQREKKQRQFVPSGKS